MFWILHGEDEFRRSEFLAGLKSDLGDQTMIDVNTTILDGRRTTMGEITHACNAIPFLGPTRLVIINDLFLHLRGQKSKGKGGKNEQSEPGQPAQGGSPPQPSLLAELEAYLSHLPDTTLLVFVETAPLPAKHPLLTLTLGDRALGKAKEFRPFFVSRREGPGQLARWIRDRGKDRGVGLTSDAVQALATHLGYDLRLVDRELEKLSAYAADTGKVSGQDVRNLVSSVREADIFEMVDALGRKDVRNAIVLLHQMLDEGKAPLYLLTMIVRQFRIIIQVKELGALGFTQFESAQQLRMHEFVVKKASQQAQRFSFDQLNAIYDSLAEYDAAIKRGKINDTLALDLLIAQVFAA